MPQGISPTPLNKISEVYLSQISEHHKKDADGNTIPHEGEEVEEGAGLYANIHAKRKRGGKMRKKGDKGAPSSQDFANAARTAKEETEIGKAKVDTGRSDYGKASIRNYRRMGPGHDEPGMFDPEQKRGKTIEKRREEHKARRGVKGAKVPAYKVEEVEVDEAMAMKPSNMKKKAKLSAAFNFAFFFILDGLIAIASSTSTSSTLYEGTFAPLTPRRALCSSLRFSIVFPLLPSGSNIPGSP